MFVELQGFQVRRIERPLINRGYILPKCNPSVPKLLRELFDKARRLAEKEMNKRTTLGELSWQEVFEDEYSLEKNK